MATKRWTETLPWISPGKNILQTKQWFNLNQFYADLLLSQSHWYGLGAL